MRILTRIQRKAAEFMDKNKEFMDKNKDLFEPPFDRMRYYPKGKEK